ncbi:MAG: VWA domain-containing protein [Acidobacteriota bacterium]
MQGLNVKIVALLLTLMFLNGAIQPVRSEVEGVKETSKQPPSSEDPVIHIGTKLVTLAITVTDSYGRLVTGLEKEHFEVFDNKVKQQVEFFSTEDLPISVALVFDRSGSMKSRVTRSLASLRRFIGASNEKDEYCLVTFNNSAQLASDYTRNPDQLANSLVMVETKGATALYDAVYIGLEKARVGRHAKKAVVILSDGQDNSSRYSLNELKKLAKESDVLIYAIGMVEQWSNDPLDLEGRWILEELAMLTGGRAFFPSNEQELQSAVMHIALELRRQYSIGFSPTTPADGKWHKLKIKLHPPKGLSYLSVRGREGYYAKQSAE